MILFISALPFYRHQERSGDWKLFDTNTYNVLRLAVGSSSYSDLPIPEYWNSMDKPHVALIESIHEQVFCFLISQPLQDDGKLWVRNLESVQGEAVVEVKHTNSDYRYYRRDGSRWMKVAEKKDQFFLDVYQRGTYPLTVATLDDNWSAFD
jgi:hypothetical protein